MKKKMMGLLALTMAVGILSTGCVITGSARRDTSNNFDRKDGTKVHEETHVVVNDIGTYAVGLVALPFRILGFGCGPGPEDTVIVRGNAQCGGKVSAQVADCSTIYYNDGCQTVNPVICGGGGGGSGTYVVDGLTVYAAGWRNGVFYSEPYYFDNSGPYPQVRYLSDYRARPEGRHGDGQRYEGGGSWHPQGGQGGYKSGGQQGGGQHHDGGGQTGPSGGNHQGGGGQHQGGGGQGGNHSGQGGH